MEAGFSQIQTCLILFEFCCTGNNVNFEQSTYSVYEDSGSVQLVLVLKKPSSTDLTVRVKMFNQQTSATSMYVCSYVHHNLLYMYCNTYIEGSDFYFVPLYISFLTGVMKVAFNVTIIEDTILEYNESFSVGVDPLTLPDKITIGISSHTTVTILNDDSK